MAWDGLEELPARPRMERLHACPTREELQSPTTTPRTCGRSGLPRGVDAGATEAEAGPGPAVAAAVVPPALLPTPAS